MNETTEQLLKEKGEKLKPLLEGELAKRSLYEFFKMAVPVLYPSVKWDFNWHFKIVCDELQETTERMLRGEPKERDLIFNLPFRSGKSILINIIYPTWIWIKQPSLSVISVSATEALATRFSHQSKILIESPWFLERFKEIKLRADSKSKLDYLNDKGGRRTAFGINSSVIGSGCNIMILDDPQTPEDSTPAALRNTLTTYQDTLYSRLDDPDIGFRVLLQQRISEGDLTEELLTMNKEGYKNICIPARLSKDLNPPELIQYYDAQGLFWPKRFSDKVLLNFEATLTPNAYASQLMQRPAPESGNIIKRDGFTIETIDYLNDKQNIQWELIIDTAYTKDTRNDPSALMLVGRHENQMIIRKVWQVWMEFNDLLSFIKEKTTTYNIKLIRIEKISSGILIFQELKRQTTIPILPLTPGSKDKLTRVQSILPQLESGRCVLIKDKWNTDFINECITFPYGRHDDRVDCLFYTMSLVRTGGIIKFF